MNSKIKILLGVFFVFALLTPIYAGQLISTEPKQVVSAQAPSTDSIGARDVKCPTAVEIKEINFVSINSVNIDNYSGNILLNNKISEKCIKSLEVTFSDGTTDVLFNKFAVKEEKIIVYDKENTAKLNDLKDGEIKVSVKITLFNAQELEKYAKIMKDTISLEMKIDTKPRQHNKDFNITGVLFLNENEIVETVIQNAKVEADILLNNKIQKPISCKLELPTAEVNPGLSKEKQFTCYFKVEDLDNTDFKEDSKEYKLKIKAFDAAGNITEKDINLTIDRTEPIVIVDPISTPTREPMLTGNVEDLTDITEFKITVIGKDYVVNSIDPNGNWSVQLDRLPRGTHTVWYSATDELGNKKEDKVDAITIIRRSGGGRRVTGTTTTPTVNPTPTPVTPTPQPVVTTPTVVNTPAPQPVVTTPTTPSPATPTETAPTTGNVAVANPEKTSGTTGFLGLSENASTGIALLIGALLVIGALGYFLFFARDKKEKE